MSKILNVELKARCSNPSELHEQLIRMGADYKGEDHQVDTYFNCEAGRLKLRKGNIENSLIFYNRSNKASSKESQIHLERLKPENNIRNVLAASYGLKVEVDKLRKIYFIDNVKFHIDEVKELGSFMEIEAIDELEVYNSEELKKQCDLYIEKLNIKEKDYIQVSYSDLLLESFYEKISREAKYFLDLIRKSLTSFKLNAPDHLCYRVKTLQEYNELKDCFDSIGTLLIESEVGGRLISTYKLKNPIVFNDWVVDVMELPSPKSSAHYETGFEHAEFVIEKSFEEYQDQFKGLAWDTRSITKKHNPELRLALFDGVSVKFHHQSLERVIEMERNLI